MSPIKPLFLVLLFLLSINFISALDFTPQGNINLRDGTYGLFGASSVNSTGNFTAISGWFNGLFNWTIVSDYFTWDGSTLTFSESQLNATIDERIGTQNGSMKNYVDAQNTSQTNYINLQNSSLVNYITLVNTSMKNYADDTFSTEAYVNTQNTSQTNYINSNNESVTNAINAIAFNQSANDSITNSIVANNASMNNYLSSNNDSVVNYIVDYSDTNNDSITNYLESNNESVTNAITEASFNQTQNDSINNYINFQNTSQTNYINLQNASVVNWVSNTFNVTRNNYVDTMDLIFNNSIVNWIQDQYYTSTQVDAINTSVNNYILDNNNSVSNAINAVGFNSTTNDSINNYIDAMNTSQINAMTAQNTSQTNYINFQNTSVTNSITANNDSMGNYVVDYSDTNNDSMKNYVDEQNTSQTNYINDNNDSVTNALNAKLDLSGGNMTGTINSTANFNTTQNLTVGGYTHFGTDARGMFPFLKSAGDVVVGNRFITQTGINSYAPPYGIAIAAHEYDSSLNMTSLGGTADLNAGTQTICDTTNPFNATAKGMFFTVIASTPSFASATGEIEDYINSSCIGVSFASAGSDTIVDATDMTYYLYPHPIFAALDNGMLSFQVGENPDAKFEIHIPNGTGFHGVYLEDTAGADQHQAFTIDQDFNGYDGIVGLNIFSEAGDGKEDGNYKQIYLEINEDNINTTHLHFIDAEIIGHGLDNSIDLIHINGDFDHLIHQGSVDVLMKGYTNMIDETTNFKTSGAGATLFANNNDYVYIGSEVNFTSIAFSLSTESNKDVDLEYYYCHDNETYLALTAVTDTTDGMQTSGTIAFVNPTNRGDCNQAVNGTGFANTTEYNYIALKRTAASVQTEPIESLITIGGSETLLEINSDMIKIAGSNGGPVTCSASYAGAYYYDDVGIQLLWCDGTDWTPYASAGDVTVHNSLSGLQGGLATEYYHLNSSTYDKVIAEAWDWVTTAVLNAMNDSNNNYIVDVNTSVTNSIASNNASVNNRIADENTSISNALANRYTKAESDAQNTSQTNYIDLQNSSVVNYADDTFLTELHDDTTPQLGGYLDADGENIGATDDEIENIYVGDTTRIYFGDGQDMSIYWNGTALLIG